MFYNDMTLRGQLAKNVTLADPKYANIFLGPTQVKAAHKMLMKLTPGIDFTNILWATFKHKDPITTKRHWCCNCLFTLLGSASVKGACRHAGEIDPRLAPPTTIGQGSCAVLWQDTVIIFGGMAAKTLVQQYSFTSGQWNNLAPMGIDHYYHKCVILPQNKNEVLKSFFSI